MRLATWSFFQVARRRQCRLGRGMVRHCDVAGRLRDVVCDTGRGEGWGATSQGIRATSPCRQGVCCDMATSQSRPAMSPRSHGGHPGSMWRHCDVAQPHCDVAVRHVGVALVRHCDVARHCDDIPRDTSVDCKCDIATSHDIATVSPATFRWTASATLRRRIAGTPHEISVGCRADRA